MLQELANSVDCAAGPSGVNPLKALAQGVEGSTFHRHGQGLAHERGGGDGAERYAADGSGDIAQAMREAEAHTHAGAAASAAGVEHRAFVREFERAEVLRPTAHPAMERVWEQHALAGEPPLTGSSSLERAWEAAARPVPGLFPGHLTAIPDARPSPHPLASHNPAVLACVRGVAHPASALNLAQVASLATQMSESLPPAERARAAARAAAVARHAVAGTAEGSERLRTLADVLGLAAPPPAASQKLVAGPAERALAERWAAEFNACARTTGAATPSPEGAHAGPLLLPFAPGSARGRLSASWRPAPPSGPTIDASSNPEAPAQTQSQQPQVSPPDATLAADSAQAVFMPPRAGDASEAGALPGPDARAVAGPMIQALRTADAELGQERFAQSKLLSFLQQVEAGEVRLDDQETHATDGNKPEVEAMPASLDQEERRANGEYWGAATAREAEALDAPAFGPASAPDATAAGRRLTEALSGDVADSSLFESIWDELADPAAARAAAATTTTNPRAASDAGPSDALDRALESGWDAAAREASAADELRVNAPLPPYDFRPNNPYAAEARPLQLAESLAASGRLADAVLAVEAAVARSPEDSRAWQLLGQLHADCDDDAAAIVALQHAVRADPHNRDALLLLGVSFTNELDQSQALRHLRRWLEAHPDLQQLAGEVPAVDRVADTSNPFTAHATLTALFERTAQLAPGDADVHAVLGVLFNLSHDYQRAIAAFEAALARRPEDYGLWNKLGATCANALEPERALPHYIRALELRPDYVRALTNLGISYGNLGRPLEGAACYLRALELNPRAAHVWSYLAMLFQGAGREDLVERTRERDVEVFRGEIDF